MYRSILPLVFAASGALAAPQATGLEGLSQCVQTAALTAIGSTNCAPSDVACLCTGTAFQSALRSAIAASCGSADVEATEEWASGLCAGAGVPLPSGSANPDPSEPGATNPPTALPTDDTPNTPDTPPDPVYDPLANNTTWVNGTCPHNCPEGEGNTPTGPSNGTAPIPSPPVPEAPAPSRQTGAGPGPLYTGAAATLASSAFSVLALAVAACALL